tara:strand:- start:6617 stop:7081 length:465 start_codon:yes stop_codon:yes gene_type:complete
MKKFLFLLVLMTFSNCSEDLSNNTPGFEASVNGNDWIAQSFNATIQNSQLSISGNNQLGTISMVIDSIDINSFELRSWTDDFAIFQDTIYYSTKNDGIGSIAYLSAGIIDINEINYIDNNVSGHFYFECYNNSGLHVKNVSEGVFYKIPINIQD